MGIFDILGPANPAVMGQVSGDQNDWARKQALMQMAAGLLSPTVGHRASIGEALSNGMNTYNTTYQNAIQQALDRKRQEERDAMEKQKNEALIAEYKSQADLRSEMAADKKAAKEAEAKRLSTMQETLGSITVPGEKPAFDQWRADNSEMGSVPFDQLPESFKAVEQGQYQQAAPPQIPFMEQLTKNNPLGAIALQQAIASGKGFDDIMKTYTVKPGEEVRSALTNMPLAKGSDKAEKANEWQILLDAAGQDPMKALQLKAQMVREGRPVTNVNTTMMPGEKAFDVETGKKMADVYQGITKDATSARSAINNLSAFQSLIKDSNTGALTPAAMKASGMLQSLGITIDPRLGPKQAAEGLSNQMALQIRSTAEGGGMPGAMSDSDRAFLQASVPNLSKTPAGNKQLADILIKMNKRKIEVGKLANNYIAKNGRLDANFNNVIQDYADKNPLFGDYAGATATPTAGRFTIKEVK